MLFHENARKKRFDKIQRDWTRFVKIWQNTIRFDKKQQRWDLTRFGGIRQDSMRSDKIDNIQQDLTRFERIVRI